MHLAPLIRDLAVILGVATLVTLIFRKIKQPVVLGYIIAGIIVGPYTPPIPLVVDLPNIKTWAELGIIFLMFSLGLEFSFRKLSRVGLSASFTAVFEVLLMFIFGFFTGKAFQWSSIDSLFLGAMLSISSTTIIIKALDELKLKQRRFAQVIFGILIVEDLAAILILVGLSTLAIHQSFSAFSLALAGGKLLLVISSWFILGYFLIPRLIKYIARFNSDEMLTISSIGLCLLLVVFSAHFQYSVALGAFIMGSILAESAQSNHIEHLMRPLRDVFAAIFFVSVGMLMDPAAIWNYKLPIAVLTFVTIFGKILSTTVGAVITGEPIRTSTQVGFGLAQIGEFSFIIATLGSTLNVTSKFLYPIGVAVSLITAFTTPYLIRISPKFAEIIEKHLPKRIHHNLLKYIQWMQSKRTSTASYNEKFYKHLLRWSLNGLIITLIWIIIAEFGEPYLMNYIHGDLILHGINWAIAILMSAPFIWAMMTTFSHFKSQRASERFLFQLLTVLWLAALSLVYFPAKYVGLFTATLAAIVFTRFYKQLEKSYRWFEMQFLSTFTEDKVNAQPLDNLKKLAPWKAYLSRMNVEHNSIVVGQTLADLALRKKYGINIVAIQRGEHVEVAPHPDQRIFPQDELLVLGTDEQVDAVRVLVEQSKHHKKVNSSVLDYDLKQFTVHQKSYFLGKSIRTAQLREKYGAMVVGIERNNKRLMNPDSDLHFESGDTVWIVAEAAKMEKLLKEI